MIRSLVIALLVFFSSHARAQPTPLSPDSEQPRAKASAGSAPGSLASSEPLGRGRMGMSVSGGLAVLLPFYAVEFGYGASPRVDLVARYETIIGVIHYPRVGVRWSPITLGSWHLGLRLDAVYRLFGIQSDNLNLTSTIYVVGEIGLSRPVSPRTEIVLAGGGDLDLVVFEVVDDRNDVRGDLRFSGANLRVGMKTRLTQDLQWYLVGRLHIPTETLQVEAQQFYAIPFIELGGTWSWWRWGQIPISIQYK